MNKELISKIEKVVHGLDVDSVYSKVLVIIMKMLNKLKPEIKIIYCEVIDDFVSIELLCQETSEYINLEVTSTNIEIRGGGYEITYFFDKEFFNVKCNDLIIAFFRGEYKVSSYFGKKDRKEAFGLIWNSEQLKYFNNEKEGVTFFKGEIIKEVSRNGLKLI